MEIKTRRCLLRPFKKSDIPHFMAYRNDMHWMRYQGFKGLTQKAYEAALLGELCFFKGAQLALVLADTGQLIGDIYLRREENILWVGYTIHPAHTRKGLALEAVTSVMQWARGQGCEEIRAGVLPENTASIRLLQKLGFHYTAQQNGEHIYTHRWASV